MISQESMLAKLSRLVSNHARRSAAGRRRE
jgi:hypothetical protein